MTAHAWGNLDDALPWRRVVVTDGERSRTVTADVCACRECGLVLARQESGVRAVGLDVDALSRRLHGDLRGERRDQRERSARREGYCSSGGMAYSGPGHDG